MNILTKSKLFLLFFFLIFLNSMTSYSQNFDDANLAFEEKKYDKAISILLNLANQNNINAHKKLGLMYKDGIGVEQNYTKSIEWLKLPAQHNDLESQKILALFYYSGKGIRKDFVKAAMWQAHA